MILYFLLVMQWRYLNGCVLHYLETGTRHGLLAIWISKTYKKDLQTIFITGNYFAFYLALLVCCKIAVIKLNLRIISDSSKDICITGESSWLHIVMCKATTLCRNRMCMASRIISCTNTSTSDSSNSL